MFGFAQLVENAAAPLTAIFMAPLAETVFMPFMTDGAGADWIGGWFGTGPERGLALMFTLAGLIGDRRDRRAFACRARTGGSTPPSPSPDPSGTVGALDETTLRDLYATPPPDFVANANEW